MATYRSSQIENKQSCTNQYNFVQLRISNSGFIYILFSTDYSFDFCFDSCCLRLCCTWKIISKVSILRYVSTESSVNEYLPLTEFASMFQSNITHMSSPERKWKLFTLVFQSKNHRSIGMKIGPIAKNVRDTRIGQHLYSSTNQVLTKY